MSGGVDSSSVCKRCTEAWETRELQDVDIQARTPESRQSGYAVCSEQSLLWRQSVICCFRGPEGRMLAMNAQSLGFDLPSTELT